MKTHVIYNRKTGEILQTHVQTDDLHKDPEELLQMARPEAKGVVLDVMEAEGMVSGTGYRVDVKRKKLVPVGRRKARGAGGAFVQPSGGDPRMARTVFLPMEQKKK